MDNNQPNMTPVAPEQPQQPQKQKQPHGRKNWSADDKAVVKGLCIALALVLCFTIGNFLGGAFPNVKVTEDKPSESQVAQPEVSETLPATPAPEQTQPQTQAPAEVPQSSAPAQTDAPKAEPQSSAPAAAPSGQKSKAEIVALFNKAANGVKKNATGATKNFTKRSQNEEKLDVPAIAKTVANGLINTFVKDDNDPVEMDKAAIKSDFPLKGQDIGSKATEADVKNATCEDTGKAYKVKIDFIETQNSATNGPANAMNVISTKDVMDAAGSVVKEFNCDYYNCSVTCEIDKATGNMTAANYAVTCDLHVKAMGISATISLNFTDDYTIKY